MRKSGDEFITHPRAVAELLVSLQLDAHTITAALLHDVVEDTPRTLNEIEDQFGGEVASLVDAVSRVEDIEKTEEPAASFSKLFEAMTGDVRVVLIKLADRLHNMRTLRWMSPKKRIRIAQETMDVYAPIAHRLGMASWGDELQDIALQAIHPLRYRVLRDEINSIILANDGVIQSISAALKKTLSGNSIVADISHRQKRLYSVYQKMQRRNLRFREILDLYALRVVVNDIDHCYRVLGIIHQLYQPIQNTLKDYIASSKSNGYQSLHTTVLAKVGFRIEVQIRTQEMHSFAESGIASHWIYKTAPTSSIRSVESAHLMFYRNWMFELNKMRDEIKSDSEFFTEMKKDIYYDQLMVYTPEGKPVYLPIKSTVLDYAYRLSSELGDTAVSGFVDERHVPLSYILANGQSVHIHTSKDAPCYSTYLNFVVTQQAKRSIRKKLEKLKREKENKHSNFHFGTCCYPIRGDRIVSIADKSGEVSTIHRSHCKKVEEAISFYQPINYPIWGTIDDEFFSVAITLILENKRWALAKASNVIAQSGYNILKLEVGAIHEGSQLATAKMLLSVKDRDDLARLLRRLDKATLLHRANRL